MCGIIAGFNTKLKGKGKKNKEKVEKINNFIMDQYQDQCHRGTKGFGIIRIDEKGNIEVDRATQENKFLIDLYLKPAKMMIAHHRQPTSSDNKISQTHPIFITDKMFKYDYLFVHNGMITNDKKLKTKHETMGYKYITEYKKEGYYPQSPIEVKFNDTEALGVEISLFIEEKQDFIEVDNQAAFMSLQIDKKTKKAVKVFFGRNGNGSALNMTKIKGNIKISSEGEGEGVIIDTLWSFDPKDDKMKLESRGMTFKVEKEPFVARTMSEADIYNMDNDNWHGMGHMSYHSRNQQPLPVNTKPVAIEGTKETAIVPITEETSELISPEYRPWYLKDENPEEDHEDEEEIFLDKKSYEAERLQQFTDTVKDDDSEMVGQSLDIALDEEKETIEKMIENFTRIIKTRRMFPRERNFYMSQICLVLKTIESTADMAGDEFTGKEIEETLKKEEEEYDDHHVGYQAPRSEKMIPRFDKKVHSEDAMPGDLDFTSFGK